jgi:TonB family protein
MKTERKSTRLIRLIIFLWIPCMLVIIPSVYADNKSGRDAGTNRADATVLPSMNIQGEIPLVEVEQLPVYHGGDAALLKFIGENAKYPEEAKKKNITGKVVVKFIVEKDCSVSDVTILKSVDPLLDAEAIRVAALLKFEKPAKNKGKSVRVYYMVPITFDLK